jgi:hypothetical protein
MKLIKFILFLLGVTEQDLLVFGKTLRHLK